VKVTLKVDVSGSRDGQPWPRRGSLVDLPDQEAADLCAAGLAEPVASRPKAEKAVAPDAEQRAASAKADADAKAAADHASAREALTPAPRAPRARRAPKAK